MTELLVRLHLKLARHRWAVLAVVLLTAAGALLLARRLAISEDFTDMLPMSNPAIAEQMTALKNLRQADRLFFDVQTTALDPEQLAEAADRLAHDPDESHQHVPGPHFMRLEYEAVVGDRGDDRHGSVECPSQDRILPGPSRILARLRQGAR